MGVPIGARPAERALRERAEWTEIFQFEADLTSEEQDSTSEETSRSSARSSASQSRWTWIVPVAVLALLGLLYVVSPGVQSFAHDAYRVLQSGEQDTVERWVSGFGAWGVVVIVVLMLLQTLVAFLPSVVPMVAAVLAYGPWPGGALAWGGLLLAAAMGYGIGRAVGPVTVDRLIGSKAERTMEEFVERYGVWAILAARVSPALSTDAVSIVAGMVKMRFPRFLSATALGTLPLTVAITWLGAEMSRLESGLVWISVVSVALFAGYVIYDRSTKVS